MKTRAQPEAAHAPDFLAASILWVLGWRAMSFCLTPGGISD